MTNVKKHCKTTIVKTMSNKFMASNTASYNQLFFFTSRYSGELAMSAAQ